MLRQEQYVGFINSASPFPSKSSIFNANYFYFYIYILYYIINI